MVYTVGVAQKSNTLKRTYNKIEGVCYIDNQKAENIRVCMLNRVNLSVVDVGYTNQEGRFALKEPFTDKTKYRRYLVVAIDDNNRFNALVYDNIEPSIVTEVLSV